MKKWTVIICLIVCPLLTWGQNFAYPVPPDTIHDRQRRINYMVEYFWNERTLSDTTCFQSPKLLLDYLYLLKQADEKEKYLHHFVSMFCKQKSTLGQILYWLDNILYDSSSPHYDEVIYLKMMKTFITSETDSVMKLIPSQRVKIMCKNQEGQFANNFSFVDGKGKINELYNIDASLLLLFFNNPDCSLCHRTEYRITKDAVLQTLLNSGKLKVLAITPDADYEEWLSHVFPSNWQIGYDREKVIYNLRLYDIQRLPCIYLLDKDKRVLLKEADYERLCKYISEHNI